MSIKALDRIHTIFSLLFIPLVLLLFYLNDPINLPMPVVLFILIIYALIVEIVGTYTLAITQGKKNAGLPATISKNQLNMDLTVLLYKNGYPPEWDEEMFDKVMEQAENFKKYND
jgi:hypothetical protein